MQSKSSSQAESAGRLTTKDLRQMGSGASSLLEGFFVPDAPALDGNTVDLNKDWASFPLIW